MNNLIITKDRFVYLDVSNKAMKLFGNIELYAYLSGEDAEWAIGSIDELEEALSMNLPIVIEGGHLPKHRPFSKVDKLINNGYVYVKYADLFK
tara:strand:+ start:1285 stop:1563 length:279 start_codon:yes stop_codon:yes gene_type:complete